MMKIIFSVLAIFGIFSQVSCAEIDTKNSWSHLVFAQTWPPALCTQNQCAMPNGLRDWVIHGIWPSDNKHSPSFCNNSLKFRINIIKPIEDKLKKIWPNLFVNGSTTGFWRHEWQKHGACATDLDPIKGQFNYFYKALELYETYNLNKILTKAGLLQSKTNYMEFSKLKSAVQGSLNNKNVKFTCINKKGQKSMLLAIYICLDRNFQVIHCDDVYTACDKSSGVILLPFQNYTKAAYKLNDKQISLAVRRPSLGGDQMTLDESRASMVDDKIARDISQNLTSVIKSLWSEVNIFG